MRTINITSLILRYTIIKICDDSRSRTKRTYARQYFDRFKYRFEYAFFRNGFLRFGIIIFTKLRRNKNCAVEALSH